MRYGAYAIARQQGRGSCTTLASCGSREVSGPTPRAYPCRISERSTPVGPAYDGRGSESRPRREPTGSFVARVSPPVRPTREPRAPALSLLRLPRPPYSHPVRLKPAAQGLACAGGGGAPAAGTAVPVRWAGGARRSVSAPHCRLGVTQLGGIHAVPPGNRAVRRFQDSQRGHCSADGGCTSVRRGGAGGVCKGLVGCGHRTHDRGWGLAVWRSARPETEAQVPLVGATPHRIRRPHARRSCHRDQDVMRIWATAVPQR